MHLNEVFGIKEKISPYSYVDRGDYDIELKEGLKRDKHIAIHGESKCGKTWLRKKVLDDAIVVQCRLHKSNLDIYIDALSQLEIKFEKNSEDTTTVSGKISATGKVGMNILAKLGFKVEIGGEKGETKSYNRVGGNINDLRYIADILIKSEKRMVIEDFHYLSVTQRTLLSFDLKSLWDYGVFIVIIGIWNQQNLLTYLNPDLIGRFHEINIRWTNEELNEIISRGSSSLNIKINDNVIDFIVQNSYGNAGILQELTHETLKRNKISKKKKDVQKVDDIKFAEESALYYSEQLNPVYINLSEKISSGFKQTTHNTRIYKHIFASIISSDDNELLKGIHINDLYKKVCEREPRINKGNLKKALLRIERLQVDNDGRGLVFGFDGSDRVYLVDRQILIYRKYMTIKWPWEE